MKFIELQQHLGKQKIFSTKELEITFGHRFKNNLLNWQKKGYIKKIVKGWYYLNDKQINQTELYQIANRIYDPSYVSLEYVLNIYNIIPEGVFNITNITTKKTRVFKSELSNFSYRNIKKEYFFGYEVTKSKTDNVYYKIASLEKAIIDYFYLNDSIKTEKDLYELRWDIDELKEQIDIKRLKKILKQYKQKTFLSRIKLFLSFIQSDDRHYKY